MPSGYLKIAVIGGGISGLSTAYYLVQQARSSLPKLDIHVFERGQMLGGNADTVVVKLGTLYDAKGPVKPYMRWADLGVNDVNLATYKLLRTMMTDVGYLGELLPLQDTESYFSQDGKIMLTDDSNLRNGVSDTNTSLQHVDKGRLAPLIKVVHRTALNRLDDKDITPDYTVGQFFQDCIDHPQGMLSKAAGQLDIHIDWTDPALAQRVTTVRDTIYFPRISAMYFTDDQGPQGMPLQAPFQYYRVQEGSEGGLAPDRRYFNNGSQKLLEHLEKYLQGHPSEFATVTIHPKSAVQATVRAQTVTIQNQDGPAEQYDWCVVTTHADDARELLTFEDSVASQYKRLDAILASVRYTGSYAVCHTHSSALPPSKNVWRTYNIQVRDPGDTFTPYRIGYVVNLHQNDPSNPKYDRAGLPQFFVSLVDNLNSIPQRDMLDRVLDSSQVPKQLLAALPQATRDQMDGGALESGYSATLQHVAEPLRTKAWTYFKHNVLNASCMRAQDAMKQYNQEMADAWRSGHRPVCPVLFGGGWTNGAGLHEQCLEQSLQISRWILPS